jgi:carboxyl-terminal processing protease
MDTVKIFSEFISYLDFIGIEVSLDETTEQIKVVSVLEGMSADQKGIQPNDIILKINNKSTAGMNLQEIVTELRGLVGTEVKLTIFKMERN